MKTRSEELFEFFLTRNRLSFTKIEEAVSHRPDYLVQLHESALIFEIKELAEDDNFGGASGSHGTIGDHVRARIHGSRKQIQYGASQGVPSVLLIYNNLDPLQMFGTDDLDFQAAMYGELTVMVNRRTGKMSDWFNGRNQLLQEQKNTSFSAVGRLSDRPGHLNVTLFENVFAKVGLPFDRMPPCFEVKRFQLLTESPTFV